MIVKDEEKNIRQCLESVRNVVNEIIIVDTGSTDKTTDICEEFHAKVYSFDWTEDFSAARNFSIEKAASDWILWLDADECLDISDLERFHSFIGQSDAVIYSMELHHLFGTTPEEDRQFYISYHHRLFRNKNGFFFKGRIHEQLTHENTELINHSQICDHGQVSHHGYKLETSRKSMRNLELLLKEKSSDPENPWLDYHLAAELYRLNDVNRAYAFVNNSITNFVVHNTLPPALAYKLKYDIIISTGCLDNAINGIEKVIELYPDYVELHFYRGIILFQEKKFEEGIKAFRYCIVLGETNPKYLILAGNGSFHAYYYIGRCYEELSEPVLAKEAYRQSLLSNPHFQQAKERVLSLNKNTGEIESKS
jgi:glycosyltransferase involved in cell wall biosynthesis